MLPDRSVLKGQKLVENAKIQMRHFEYFSSLGDFENIFLITAYPYKNGNNKTENNKILMDDRCNIINRALINMALV